MSSTTLTIAQHIFNVRYGCRIQNAFLQSEVMESTFGIPTTGDAAMDKASMTATVPMYLTIAQMVYYYSLGSSIGFQNPKDSVTIYLTIKEHLINWEQVVSSMFNAPSAPLDDLRQMDIFASAIYWVAVQNGLRVKEERSAFRWRTNRTTLAANLKARAAEEPKETIDEGHKPLTESIARFSFGRKNS